MWSKVAQYLAKIEIDEKSATEIFVNSLSFDKSLDDNFYSERIKSIAQFVPVSLLSLSILQTICTTKLLKDEIELNETKP